MVRRISDDASEECLVLPCALTGERCRMHSDPDEMRRLNSLDASRFVTNSAESCEHANRKVLSPRQVHQEEITSESGRNEAFEADLLGKQGTNAARMEFLSVATDLRSQVALSRDDCLWFHE